MLHMHLQFGSPAVKGESADKDHQGWIELKSWDHSIVQPRRQPHRPLAVTR